MDLFAEFETKDAGAVATAPAPPRRKSKPDSAPVQGAEAVGVRLATPEQVEQLVGFFYDGEKVKKWTYERAGLVLNGCRRAARLITQRALHTARAIDAGDAPPSLWKRAPEYLRDDAATGVEQAAGDDDELRSALGSALWLLDDYELRFVASQVVRMLRGES